ncbi:MAG: hypothetical protein ACE5EC_06775, partial [Phycisphaerae bacterium]
MVLSTIDLQDWIGKNSIGAEVPWSRLEMILPEGCKPEARVLDDCVFRFREILSDSQSETI